MATIHLLKPNPARPRRIEAHTGSAEIIIFPGVRYERWAEPAQHEADKPKRRRRSRARVKRDTISIVV